MNTPTAWAERTVVKDAPAIMDAADRLRTMDGFYRTLDLEDLTVTYELDEGQPQTWEQPYYPARVIVTWIESPKLPGIDLLPLFAEADLRAFCDDILTAD